MAWLCDHAVQVHVLNSSTAVFVYHALGLLLHHLWSIYNISGTSDSSNLASMCSYDQVGPPGVTDACRVYF